MRFRLGAYDADVPFADKAKYGKGTDMSGYEALSLEAAQQSMVLLKNDGFLPLTAEKATAYRLQCVCRLLS